MKPLYVLDTDTLTLFDHRNPQVIINLAMCQDGLVATTVISVEEILSGWYSMLRSANRPDRLAEIYGRLANAVRLLSQFELVLNVGSMDLKIAAIALESGCTVVTGNLRDFRRVTGLMVEDWSS